jgi:UDP-glucose 4-epimerase
MNVLVTGGAGYIGSVTVEALCVAGERVVVLDDLSRGHRKALNPDVPFYEGDTGDELLVRNIVASHAITQVVHFAGFTSVPESVEQPLRYFENNTGKVIRMLTALLSCGVKNIVFSSTAAVYGEPEHTPIDEEHRKNPTSPYGLSKYFVENILDRTDFAHGMTHVALRYFNAAGALATKGEDHRPETHLIPLILQVPMGKRTHVCIYGVDYPTPDGTCVRDYIHVADLADAHVRALRYLADGGRSQKINLGNGKGFSVREVIDVAERVTGTKIPVQEEARRAGDPSVLIAGSEKARSVLGWSPRYPALESIVSSSWKWYRSHPEGYPKG